MFSHGADLVYVMVLAVMAVGGVHKWVEYRWGDFLYSEVLEVHPVPPDSTKSVDPLLGMVKLTNIIEFQNLVKTPTSENRTF